MDKSDFSIREVTKGAFTQARAKLNPWAFMRLNEVAVNTFYEQNEVYTWHGMRTLSVDGTRLVLPNHPSVKEDSRVKLTLNITYELDKEEFTSHSKDGLIGVFTRKRKLTIKNLNDYPQSMQFLILTFL